MKIAYTMSRFPKLTETFILFELIQLERLGFELELFPLIREKASVRHPEAQRWVERAHFLPFISARILLANLRFALRSPGKYFSTLIGILSETVGSLNFFFGSIGIFPKAVAFAEQMRDLGIEHLHAHFANHPATAAYIINRLTALPFSFTGHGSDLHKEQRLLARKVAAAEFVVTVSEYNKEFIIGICGELARSKIEVIHCGVDTQTLTPVSHPSGGSGLRIVSVGSLGEVKGHRYLIQACQELKLRGIPFQCHIIGDGELRQDLARLICDLELQTDVFLLGAQPRQQVLETISRADVVALTSVQTRQGKREGIPVALMEGMAFGLPAVSSRLSGIPELVEDGKTGFLSKPGDSNAIADSLERLARDPEARLRMGKAARETVLSHFDLDHNTRRLAAKFLS